MNQTERVRQILDLARWAPSGDNTQPWRFEILGENRVLVHGFDTRDHCVYDLDGRASQLSMGCLLETLRIAATQFGLEAVIARRAESEETKPVFDVHFVANRQPDVDPLAQFITQRTVQRRPMKTRPLGQNERLALEASLPEQYQVLWFSSFAERLGIARLLFTSAKIRLVCPEAYAVHRKVIEWGASYSEDKIPEKAVGVDTVTARLMRWVMKDWSRVRFFNSYMAGTWIPRLELDLVPALRCAAHFAIRARTSPQGLDDYVAAGQAVQRLWLTATRLGLFIQPEMTPLIFCRYARDGRRFSAQTEIQQMAQVFAKYAQERLGAGFDADTVFFCRIGESESAPKGRSLRLPLSKLWVTPE